MWREKFRIGVEPIDEQHKELFETTEKLLQEMQNDGFSNKPECISMLIFLKQYALKHFADEEELQLAVGYKYYTEHRKLHANFVSAMLRHEKKLDQSNYSDKDTKEFVGFLLTYMLYHVAVIDQEIIQNTEHQDDPNILRYKIWHGFSKVFCKLTGHDKGSIRSYEHYNRDLKDAVTVKVDFHGAVSGYLIYIYTMPFIKNLAGSLMDITMATVDELETSVLREMSNIISVTICGNLLNELNESWGVGVPYLIDRYEDTPDEKIILKTALGVVEINIAMKAGGK